MKYMVNGVDCWYNKEEGYFINDIYKDCNRIELKNPYSVREVLSTLRKINYNFEKGKYTTNVKEFMDASIFEVINRKTGEYVLQLELIEE